MSSCEVIAQSYASYHNGPDYDQRKLNSFSVPAWSVPDAHAPLDSGYSSCSTVQTLRRICVSPPHCASSSYATGLVHMFVGTSSIGLTYVCASDRSRSTKNLLNMLIAWSVNTGLLGLYVHPRIGPWLSFSFLSGVCQSSPWSWCVLPVKTTTVLRLSDDFVHSYSASYSRNRRSMPRVRSVFVDNVHVLMSVSFRSLQRM